MPKAACLALDTKDDRREMHQLLERIPPRLRLQWLASCCRMVTGPHSDKVRVKATTTGENAMEVFLDAWQLFVQYQLDPTAAAVELERLARDSAGLVFAFRARPALDPANPLALALPASAAAPV